MHAPLNSAPSNCLCSFVIFRIHLGGRKLLPLPHFRQEREVPLPLVQGEGRGGNKNNLRFLRVGCAIPGTISN
jgi:hypothetical protein